MLAVKHPRFHGLTLKWTSPNPKLCIALSELLVAAPVLLYLEQRQVPPLTGYRFKRHKQQPLFVDPVGLFTEEICYATPTDQNDHRESRDSDCSEHNDGPRGCALDEAA